MPPPLMSIAIMSFSSPASAPLPPACGISVLLHPTHPCPRYPPPSKLCRCPLSHPTRIVGCLCLLFSPPPFPHSNARWTAAIFTISWASLPRLEPNIHPIRLPWSKAIWISHARTNTPHNPRPLLFSPCLCQRQLRMPMPFYPATRAAMLVPSTVAAIIAPATCQIHTDQTDKFVIASNNGDNYVLVLYDYNSNSILVEALQSCTGQCFLIGNQIMHARLVAVGLRPILRRIDNECSVALKHIYLSSKAWPINFFCPGPPSAQCSQACDWHVQKSFCCWSLHRQQKFPPSPLGQTYTPS